MRLRKLLAVFLAVLMLAVAPACRKGASGHSPPATAVLAPDVQHEPLRPPGSPPAQSAERPPDPPSEEVPDQSSGPLTLAYPFPDTLFPADIRSPEVRWTGDAGGHLWRVRVSFGSRESPVEAFATKRRWTPEREVWERIKQNTTEHPGAIEVCSVPAQQAPPLGHCERIGFSTSVDPVSAAIFYRDVPTPIPDQKRYVKVKWRLARVSSYDPPLTVMANQGKCFNCHSISPRSTMLGFEYNAEGKPGDHSDRAGYLLHPIDGSTIAWTPEDYFDWNKFPGREAVNGEQAFFSVFSPDGRYVATAGRAIAAVFTSPSQAECVIYSLFSQASVLYADVATHTIHMLPGADDKDYVNLPDAWSPEGKYLILSRTRITPQMVEWNRHPEFEERTPPKDLRTLADLDRRYPERYDLYRIPFNEGRGGKPVPIPGASRNGRSNFFARVSPNGKWIVFEQTAGGGMTLRRDGDLYILPFRGGTARRLRCNGPAAESWHSWAPNSRWLVFSSKSYGPQTTLVLTHIDDRGNDSPPILLTQLRDTSPEHLVANLPEFFNIPEGKLEKLDPSALADFHPQ